MKCTIGLHRVASGSESVLTFIFCMVECRKYLAIFVVLQYIYLNFFEITENKLSKHHLFKHLSLKIIGSLLEESIFKRNVVVPSSVTVDSYRW